MHGSTPSSRPKLLSRLAFVSGCFLLLSCRIVLVSGPSEVAVGETVTYVLSVSSNNVSFFDGTVYVVADVPEGWQLVSSTYVSTTIPTSGVGTVVSSTVCDDVLGPVRPGFVRLHIRSETFPQPSTTDVGEVTLEFFVADQPADAFDVFFAFGYQECSAPAAVTIHRRQPGFLTLVQALFDGADGVEGLSGPRGLTVSPDGRHLYVASEGDQMISVFSRDEASGELTFVEVLGDVHSLGLPVDVAVSPDGRHVYTASRFSDQIGAIATFVRDSETGRLTLTEQFYEDVTGLEISPDGRHLYAVDTGMTVYGRDAASGELTFLQIVPVNPSQTFALTAAASADGRHLYATSHGVGIFVFGRDETTGRLTWLQTRSPSGHESSLSPDGRHLYTATNTVGQGISLSRRDPATGSLQYVETLLDRPYLDLRSVATTPDGSHVITGNRSGLVVYRRDTITGGLTSVDALYAGNLPIDELAERGALAFEPESGRHLYAVDRSTDALLVFRTAILFADGFESGSASKWSVTVP